VTRTSSQVERFTTLLRMQLARVRTSWRPYLIVSSAMPLGIAVLLRAIMDPKQVDRFGEQIVAGSAVLAIAMTAIVMLAQRIAALKESGGLDFYSSLPVKRWLFDLSLTALWAAVPVWALGSFALAGLGVGVGLAAPDEQLAGMYSNLVMMAVLFLGIIPTGRLPGWLEPVRAILPSTYAVDALKPGLAGSFTSGQVWDLLLLAVFGTLFFWAVRGPLWPRPD
jgi:ABC-2 type transport system permease protein